MADATQQQTDRQTGTGLLTSENAVTRYREPGTPGD